MRDAEVARFDGSPEQPDRWAIAVRCCRVAGLGWDAAVSTLRWCQAMLDDGAARGRVAGPLRDAHAYALREGAQGLAADVEALATSARVPLLAVGETPLPSQRRGEAGPLATLTRREREVLDHLVAGRTYAEIARALFISEKTVSAHVSNLLRKTGTTSRHEVSALALRMSAVPR
jgi:DNA-binding CsgD family transcriptional regulator